MGVAGRGSRLDMSSVHAQSMLKAKDLGDDIWRVLQAQEEVKLQMNAPVLLSSALEHK